MKFSQAERGRVFVIRLEHEETVHEEIEQFARTHSITAGTLTVLGGAAPGSKFVVGPENSDDRPVNPMVHTISGVREVTGTGTLFPDEQGHPSLHMHMACGREAETITGCIRNGVRVWQVMEVVLIELVGSTARRVMDPDLGFNLLHP